VAADRYQLAAVRDARERDERGKRGELASSVGDAREALARLEAAQGRTKQARTALAEALTAREACLAASPTPAWMARIANADRFVMRRRHELDAALGEELRAHGSHDAHQGVVDVQRMRLARARADREVIDRHFARWREGKHKLAERRED
jgi:hypothetical protein